MALLAAYMFTHEGHPNVTTLVEVHEEKVVQRFPDMDYSQCSIYAQVFICGFKIDEVTIEVGGSRPRDWLSWLNHWVSTCGASIRDGARQVFATALSAALDFDPETVVFSADIETCTKL